jgi:hypothetical protein
MSPTAAPTATSIIRIEPVVAGPSPMMRIADTPACIGVTAACPYEAAMIIARNVAKMTFADVRVSGLCPDQRVERRRPVTRTISMPSSGHDMLDFGDFAIRNVRIHRELRRRRNGRWNYGARHGGDVGNVDAVGHIDVVRNISDTGNVDHVRDDGNRGHAVDR